MSLTPEENKTPDTVEEEQSTIFGASPLKDEKPREVKKHKMLKTALSMLLVLLMLAGATLAVIKLIPEKEDETPSTDTQDVTVYTFTDTDVESVSLKRGDGTVVYNAALKESSDSSESTTSVVWSIEGIDAALIDASSLSSHMDSLITLSAIREIEAEDGADYGFASPLYTINVKTRKGDLKTLLVGNKTPSDSGFYAKLDGGDKLYLLSSDTVAQFDTKNEELAVTTVISAAVSDSATEKYFQESTLTYFDSLTLKRKNAKTISFISNFDDETNQLIPYMLTSPVNRAGDTEAVTNLVSIASGGLNATAAYVLNPTAKDMALFGLNSPEMEFELKYGGKTIKLTATEQSDGYFAVMSDSNSKIIFKVNASDLPFANATVDDFLSSMPFIEMITNFESITCATKSDKHVFAIAYATDEDGEEDISSVTVNGKEIDDEQFRTYYQYLVGTEPNETVYDKVSGEADFTITCKGRGSNKTTVLKFIKQTDRRYYFEINGEPIGLVSTTYAEKLISYANDLAAGKEIPEY